MKLGKGERFVRCCDIDFFCLVFWVGHFVGEGTVIGQDKETGRIVIQAADGKDSLFDFNDIKNGFSFLRVKASG